MALRRAPDRAIDSSAVTEVEIDSIRGAREAALRGDRREPEVAAQAVEAGALASDEVPVRAFASLIGGEVGAYCVLRVAQSGAKITEIGLLERSRGHGAGRGVVWATAVAARRARSPLVFVEAQDEEWDKSVYRRVGFDELGATYRFIRPWGDD
jgi:hypothetical protein